MSDESLLEQLTVESYRKLYEHLWHVDRQRMAFTGFYAIVIAGSLAVFFSNIVATDASKYVILSFAFGLSFFGLLFNIRANQHTQKHADTIRAIAEDLGIQKYAIVGETDSCCGLLKLRYLYLTLFTCGSMASLVGLGFVAT